MAVTGIDEITYRADDLQRCAQFFRDWGLQPVSESAQELVFQTLNGSVVRVAHPSRAGLPPALEDGPTVVEVVWGVENDQDLQQIDARLQAVTGYQREGARVRCQDPNGLTVGVQVSRKQPVTVECTRYNTWNERNRIDHASPVYERATPIDLGHIVFHVKNREEAVRFYEDKLGFVASDHYPGRGTFMRCAPRGGHHDLFLLQLPSGRCGVNHVAFTVRDIQEVIGGGLAMDRLGWKTELGPGRHPVSSAWFWYFENPAGALAEYYSDEDELTEAWQPRDFEPGPTVFAEWAISGGIDGNTRRQKGAEAPPQRFMTDKTQGK